MKTVLALVAAVASVFCLIPAAAEARAGDCGLDKAGDIYLTPITKRQGIGCTQAKTVARGARRQEGGDAGLFCRGRVRYGAWTITPDSYPGLTARFSKQAGGKAKRFRLATQGSCRAPALARGGRYPNDCGRFGLSGRVKSKNVVCKEARKVISRFFPAAQEQGSNVSVRGFRCHGSTPRRELDIFCSRNGGRQLIHWRGTSS